MGINAGVEVRKGNCEKYGNKYTWKRTTLVAVRRFVRGDLHDTRTPEREEEWKQISELRTALVHGLRDRKDLEQPAHESLSALLHYLHDAVAHLSHAHHLEVDPYILRRASPSRLVFLGTTGEVPADKFAPVLEGTVARWFDDPDLGLLPDYNITANVTGVEVRPYLLRKPIALCAERDLLPMRWVDPTDSDER